jgi:hypothetical protein
MNKLFRRSSNQWSSCFDKNFLELLQLIAAFFFHVFQPKIAAKSVIMVCIRFIICVVSFDDTKVRRIPSLKLGRISVELFILPLMLILRWKGELSILGVESTLVLRKLHLLFAISLVIRRSEHKRMLQSGLGRTLCIVNKHGKE